MYSFEALINEIDDTVEELMDVRKRSKTIEDTMAISSVVVLLECIRDTARANDD